MAAFPRPQVRWNNPAITHTPSVAQCVPVPRHTTAASAHSTPPTTTTTRVIVWDVDNARPPRDAPPAAVLAELGRVLAEACGDGGEIDASTSTTFHACANASTWAARPDLEAALSRLASDGSTVYTTPTTLRNSADALCSSAVVAATAAGATGVAVVSGDAGLATAVAYAAACGVLTVAVGDFGKGDSRQERHALVRAAGGRAVAWRDVVQRVRETEREKRHKVV